MAGTLQARVASRFAVEFRTQDALNKYMQEHPRANPRNHWVRGQRPGAPEEAKKPEPPAGPPPQAQEPAVKHDKHDANIELMDKHGVPRAEIAKFCAKLDGQEWSDEDVEKRLDAIEDRKLGEASHKLFGKKLEKHDFKRLCGGESQLPKGYHIDVVGTRKYQKGDDIALVAHVMHTGKSGKPERVGYINRHYYQDKGEVVVDHQEFMLDEAHQGSGVGKAVFNAQIDEYEKLGVGRVELTAAMVGKYVWTKANFEWTDEMQLKGLRNKFEEHLTEKIGWQVAEKIIPEIKSGQDIANITIGGKRVGKDFLIGLTQEEVYDATGSEFISMAQAPSKIRRL